MTSPTAPSTAGHPGAASDRWFTLLTGVATLIVAGAWLGWLGRDVVLLQGDSGSYLTFGPDRTAGYPLFLTLIISVTGSTVALPAVQLALFLTAAWWLALSVRIAIASRFLGAAVLAGILGNVELVRYCFMIMTEAPFATLVMVAAGAACRLLTDGRLRWLTLASATIGLAILVRPSGYALIAALPVLAALAWPPGLRRRGLAVVAVAVPLMVAVGGGAAAYHARHGLWSTQSFLGITMMSKAARFADVAVPSTRPELMSWLASRTESARRFAESLPDWRWRFLFLSHFSNHWAWTVGAGEAAQRLGLRDQAAINTMLVEVSGEVLAAAPGAYLADIALNLAALWTMPDAMTTAEAAKFRGWLETLGPVPDLGRFPYQPQGRSALLVWGMRLILISGLAASAIAVIAGLLAVVRRSRPTRPLAVALVAATMVHASFVLTAALQPGIPRYVWPMWPLILVISAAVASEMPQWLRGLQKLRRLAQSGRSAP